MKFNTKNVYKAISLLGLAATIAVCIAALKAGVFQSADTIRSIVEAAGIFGPLLFITIQIIQVVIPIIPGGITLLAGVIIFGPVWGFVYNYIGIVIGSMLAFLIVRKLGREFLQNISSKHYHNYISWIDKGKRFERMFVTAILLPVAPDDFLCMFAGLTKMSFKKLTAILLLCKPPTIIAYSMGLSTVAAWVTSVIR